MEGRVWMVRESGASTARRGCRRHGAPTTTVREESDYGRLRRDVVTGEQLLGETSEEATPPRHVRISIAAGCDSITS
ncbi:hypothetical protein MRX96_012149 [Rhipicephalus microplus]